MKRICLAIFITLLLSSSVRAASTHMNDGYPSLGRGIRPLGMGNAFLSMKGSDENAIFYNPSAVNDYPTDFKFRVMSPSVSFNYKAAETIMDLFDLNGDLDKSATDGDRIEVFNRFVDQHNGEFTNVGVTLIPAIMMHKYITLSLIVDGRETISFRNRAFPSIEIRSRNDGGLVAGSALSLLGGDLQAGIAVKLIERIINDKIITTNDIVSHKDIGNMFGWDRWKKGFGAGVDLGVKYHLRNMGTDLFYFLDPVAAVVYQDIGNTRFIGKVDETPQSVNAGFGIHPELFGYKISAEASFADINRHMDIWNKFHAGVEVIFPEVYYTKFSLRAGTNQGYPAGGFSADWDVARLDLAFYGEEAGQYTRVKAIWKFAGGLSFGF